MEASNLDAKPVSLTKSALQGVISNYAGIAVLVVAQIAATAATARLISPAWFGAYAAAQFALMLASYFTISTISLGLLRRAELGEKTVGSAITLSLTAATLVMVLMWVFAAPWAAAWKIGSATTLVRVLAVALFFTSLASVPIALVRRRLRFGVAAIAETSAQVCGMGTGVTVAVFTHSAIALAIGQVVSGAILFFWASVLARRDLRFGFDRSEGRELLTYGSQLSGLYFGSWAVNAIPGWIAGRSFGAFTLGLYSRASLLINLPVGYLQTGITKVLFPLYGRVRDDIARTKTMLSEGLALATGFTWPVFAFVAGAAPVVVDSLLGPKWHGATPLLRLCALIACGLFPTGLLTNAAEALGWIRFATFRLIVLLVLLSAAVGTVELAGLGLNSLLGGVAVAQWATYAIMLRTFVSRGVVDSRLMFRSHFAHALGSLGAFAIAFGIAELLAGESLVVAIVAELGALTAVCVFIFFARPLFPASEILARRLAEVIPASNPWFARLRLKPAQ